MEVPVFLPASQILARIGATAFGSGFIAAADAAAGRSALGLVIGTNVQAYSANLAALSALTVGTGANNLVQLTAASKLPAVDGSLLTNLTISGYAALATVNTFALAQTFTGGLFSPTIRPIVNGTAALQFQTVAGVPVMTIDTTRVRVGIGTTDVDGANTFKVVGNTTFVGNFTVTGSFTSYGDFPFLKNGVVSINHQLSNGSYNSIELKTLHADSYISIVPGNTETIRFGTNKIGLHGATPIVRSTGWAATNVTTDKVFDANATTLDELADVVGTLITWLISRGDLAA